MTTSSSERRPGGARKARPGQHVILYDGVCGVCNRFNRFVLKRDPKARFVFAPLQTETARSLLAPHGLTPDDLDTLYVIVSEPGGSRRALSKARAVFFVLAELGGKWRALAALRVLPKFLLNLGYDAFARHRYRWLGRWNTCPLPKPEELSRFLET